MKLFLFLIIIFKSMFALAMDPVDFPLNYDPSFPARLQSLLQITARYLPTDPWNLEETAKKGAWDYFYRYFIEFTRAIDDCDDFFFDQGVPEEQKYKDFSRREKLISYIKLGQMHEPDLFDDKTIRFKIEDAARRKDDRAFLNHCRILNRDALWALIETKMNFTKEQLEEWEQESYMLEQMHNSEIKRMEQENRVSAKVTNKIPSEFRRSYKPPIPITYPKAQVSFRAVGTKSVAPVSQPVKKKKILSCSCFCANK